MVASQNRELQSSPQNTMIIFSSIIGNPKKSPNLGKPRMSCSLGHTAVRVYFVFYRAIMLHYHEEKHMASRHIPLGTIFSDCSSHHVISNGACVSSRASVLGVRCSTRTFNTHALSKLSIRNRQQSDLTDPLLPLVVWLALARPHALSEYLRNQGCRCLLLSKAPCIRRGSIKEQAQNQRTCLCENP